MKRLMMIPLMMFVMGSECERNRLNDMDKGFIVENGTSLIPMVLPWEVIGNLTIEHPDVFYEVLDDMNEWFFPTVVFSGGIDSERFDEVDGNDPNERNGIILVWVGALPDPDWDEPGPGGIADLTWNDAGEILRADVVIDAEHSYDSGIFRARLIHELGHCLGLTHDVVSVDLDSCMASPPLTTCSITERDVERVRQDYPRSL
jgi:hypothetical protein